MIPAIRGGRLKSAYGVATRALPRLLTHPPDRRNPRHPSGTEGTSPLPSPAHPPRHEPDDGGHLVCVPRRLHYLSVLAAEVLAEVCGARWWNFQENGNWSLPKQSAVHAHVHVYGRATDAVNQPFGEALHFPEREDLDEWSVEDYDLPELVALREASQRLERTKAFQRATQLILSIQEKAIDG